MNTQSVIIIILSILLFIFLILIACLVKKKRIRPLPRQLVSYDSDSGRLDPYEATLMRCQDGPGLHQYGADLMRPDAPQGFLRDKLIQLEAQIDTLIKVMGNGSISGSSVLPSVEEYSKPLLSSAYGSTNIYRSVMKLRTMVSNTKRTGRYPELNKNGMKNESKRLMIEVQSDNSIDRCSKHDLIDILESIDHEIKRLPS